MARFAFLLQIALTVAVMGTECRLVTAQMPPERAPSPVGWSSSWSAVAPAKPICKVYSLADLGDDSLGPWVAETIPAVIEPETWNQGNAKCTLRYYAPRQTLVVYHTAEVHEKVQAFLSEVRKKPSQPGDRCVKAHAEPTVVRASYITPCPSAKGSSPIVSYPVPAPLQQPKHL